jgi:hypothetical protein
MNNEKLNLYSFMCATTTCGKDYVTEKLLSSVQLEIREFKRNLVVKKTLA